MAKNKNRIEKPVTSTSSYISSGIKAGNHTPIYKMHRYFARRPHNVFRNLIEFYTKPGDIILDPFCGGGVTLIEGLATNRRVVAVDTNPLATFITDCQTTPVSIHEYEQIMEKIESEMRIEIGKYYSTTDRDTGMPVDTRWIELAYKVLCKTCQKVTVLSNDLKLKNGIKSVNGKYSCSNCSSTVVSVNAERVGYEIIAVIYKDVNGKRVSTKGNDGDLDNFNYFEHNFSELIKNKNLWYPKDAIPSDWDRQQEDCLHRKSINLFSDFYTKRLLYSNSYLLKLVQQYKGKVDPGMYKMLLFTFSAVVRYTNNMTVSAGNWMDGRPVAWAKHAFWIPNQFVEVNPLEYIRMRRDAIVSGLKYQQQIIFQNKLVNDFSTLSSNRGTHMILTQSSEKLPILDNSIDAIITDPPYGSNVQYGELSHYWLVWLQKDLNLDSSLFSLNQEILVNRKSKNKTYSDYEEGMFRVFEESFRVLKPSGLMTFTFNNKDIRAWYAVIKAAVRAGFILEPEGVIYQDPIENYKNTAHTRFAGTVHGDFIYTFKKEIINLYSQNDLSITRSQLISSIRNYLKMNHTATTSELYVVCIQQLIPAMVQKAKTGAINFSLKDMEELDLVNIDNLLSKYLQYDEDKKTWLMQN